MLPRVLGVAAVVIDMLAFESCGAFVAFLPFQLFSTLELGFSLRVNSDIDDGRGVGVGCGTCEGVIVVTRSAIPSRPMAEHAIVSGSVRGGNVVMNLIINIFLTTTT